MFMFGTKLITQVLKWLEAEGKNSCFVVFPFALTAMPNFPIIIYKTTVHEILHPGDKKSRRQKRFKSCLPYPTDHKLKTFLKVMKFIETKQSPWHNCSEECYKTNPFLNKVSNSLIQTHCNDMNHTHIS